MAYLKFLNSSEVYKCKVIPQDNIVTLKFDSEMEVSTAGFDLYLDEKCQTDIGVGFYHAFTTIYRNDDTTAEYNGYQLSSDGSVYVEPEPTPEPEPYEPTLEEVQEAKVSDMNAAQQQTIENGVDVKLTSGQTEHFSLTQYDQQSLMGLQTLVDAGQESIPWHNSDETEHCKFYSNADMALIISSALVYVTYHVTYFRDLRIYIRALTDKEAVQAIQYGDYIPLEYQSEVLQTLLAQM